MWPDIENTAYFLDSLSGVLYYQIAEDEAKRNMLEINYTTEVVSNIKHVPECQLRGTPIYWALMLSSLIDITLDALG